MLKDSDAHKFKLLIVFSLDRFSREGISNTTGYIKRLKQNGVAIKSISEPWLDTTQGGIGELLLAIMSWVAEQDRKRIVEKTRLKLDYYKEQIKKNGYYTTKEGVKKFTLGRPEGSLDKKKRRQAGYNLRYANGGKEVKKT